MVLRAAFIDTRAMRQGRERRDVEPQAVVVVGLLRDIHPPSIEVSVRRGKSGVD